MPDLIKVFEKQWKFILGLTILAVVVAFIATLFSPKKYLSVATALPANSVVADKARTFNSNIEALYSDFGSPDELDKLEGTAMLDTIFIAVVNELDLISHYDIRSSGQSLYKAVKKLKEESKINRSAYGELKVKVWDTDRNKAAQIANALLQNLKGLHQQLQNETNKAMLSTLQIEHEKKLKQYRQISDTISSASGADAELWQSRKIVLLEQLQQYEKLADQYRLAANTNSPVLLTVEKARPATRHDKPETLVTVLLSGFVAFAFAYLVALFVESRKSGV